MAIERERKEPEARGEVSQEAGRKAGAAAGGEVAAKPEARFSEA
jgi:hypothetical protein